MEDIIKHCYEYLVSHLSKAEMSQEEIEYRIEHSMRVANYAKFIAEKEDANVKICTIAGLLHDVGKFDTEDNWEHGRVSGQVAREFLKTTDLSKKEIEEICYAIAVHVDGKCGYEHEETLEAKITGDADNLDRYGAFRIYQTLDWNEDNISGSIESRIEAVRVRLQKRYQLLKEFDLDTKTANVIWKDYLKHQIDFFERYLKELEMTHLPLYK